MKDKSFDKLRMVSNVEPFQDRRKGRLKWPAGMSFSFVTFLFGQAKEKLNGVQGQ
jgi:hypothetical protein